VLATSRNAPTVADCDSRWSWPASNPASLSSQTHRSWASAGRFVIYITILAASSTVACSLEARF
jgi:hypothetical protein